MFLESALVFGLMAVAVLLMGAVLFLALRRASAVKPKKEQGVLVRIACPAAANELLRVRVGRDREAGEFAVLWCERFGDGPVTCDRACITAPDETVAVVG